ncbi:IS1096 element passenger TnpR family protein [Streptomyces sp. T028]|uniref:IS1096 element passenger TnpR family protein n=1 Tax=Streptomyces sp. T028 TaxID=3394379 RepID=UPI003A895587
MLLGRGAPATRATARPVRDERTATLTSLPKPGAHLVYTYDFGDSWEHLITVEQFQTASAGRRVGEDHADLTSPTFGAWASATRRRGALCRRRASSCRRCPR